MGNQRSFLDMIMPITGTVVPITEVPDATFADKLLGDGVAILPEEGEIYSPVTGEVIMIAPTKHAYGIKSENGVQILIHFGLETVSLDGAAFDVKVEVGSKVTAGELIAKVDMDLLKEHNINTVTPMVILEKPENCSFDFHYGKFEAGKDICLSLVEEGTPEAETPAEPVAEQEEKTKKKALDVNVNFDVLQKLGKTLITVIAVMPAAGLMISLGKVFQISAEDIQFIFNVGIQMENIGWAIIANLNILFAVAIGGSWAKEKAGGAFSAIIAFLLINRLTGSMLNVTNAMLANPDATTTTFFGQVIPVSGYFVEILGQPALNMGVFVGIISGFVGGMVYNKFYNFRRLPEALAFFNGKRFVPLMAIIYSVVISIVVCIIWPFVQTGINNFGIWIANSASTSPLLAPFVYGTLERLLLPFGLHHMITIPINYTSFGGTYEILTGANAGSKVFGQDPLWLAWVNDLINYKNAGDMASYSSLLASVTPARFKVGQMIGSSGLLLGVALGLYQRIDKDKREKYKSMFISTVLAVFLTGVTEPIEFMFMFAAVPLYVVYAIIQGCAFAMAGFIDLRLHSFGNIEFATRLPMSIKAGLGFDILNFVICCVVFFLIGWGVSYWMIGKFKYATPGRLGNYDGLQSDEDAPAEGGSQAAGSGNAQAEAIIALLGGRSNIVLVDACMTRLRVTVKDPNLVGDTMAWKQQGALGLVKKDKGIQAIYGPKADNLKNDINDIL